MIFTGVTGGEIISLLYPLFILSPFCYIIISKESLDGTSSIVCGTWSIPDSKENDRFIQGRWNHGRDSVVSVCDDDRNDRVGDPGVGDVRISDRCGYYR